MFGQEEALQQKWAQVLDSTHSLRKAAIIVGPGLESMTRRTALLIRRALTVVHTEADQRSGAGEEFDPTNVLNLLHLNTLCSPPGTYQACSSIVL